MSLKILLVDTDAERAETLEKKLGEAGFVQVSRVGGGQNLIAAVDQVAPDLVIIDMALPDRDTLEDVRLLSASSPRPVVMFSDKNDPDFVDEAIAAGVCSYNLTGISAQEVKPIMASAVALFRRYRHVETELAAAKAQLEERRLLERAKAILMRNRKMTEPEAYRWLQRKAMNENRKLPQVVAELVNKDEADARRK
jgi:response regulator NasT